MGVGTEGLGRVHGATPKPWADYLGKMVVLMLSPGSAQPVGTHGACTSCALDPCRRPAHPGTWRTMARVFYRHRVSHLVDAHGCVR